MSFRIFRDFPFGRFGVEEKEGAVTHLYLNPAGAVLPAEERETPLLAEAMRQLAEYFAGERREFELPLAPEGTPFMRRVWAELVKVPYGATATYGEIAERIGNPGGSRAVGLANNRNPIAIIIPCHRIIGSSGKLVGYAGGVELKERLLALESGSPLLF
ncbi:methylated-DNA--[protein]-cysteine S-methyltransferase [Victivallis vadensis]|uniref:Methylated-DNA--protein-cysteine methyltransferase n=1 Tax=Victivallis vadensis TaxID=172901 RepID=A0A2U1ARW7_9BACT|nr:methylated-DNA--[protein]-cysteine S-methyltransferase [Victivallis vadensis]NMD86204.1 methylated-DNA--[protein]-cysteine S-methyltransferase [Victivallis vadensis]PVY39148.1 methylated-DNA-[protein]-cysteine S-methyltransferase [Victivallis vadensis]PWM81295.1 MAG: cysteine methyltransferase [Lentisphaerota bacterium]HJH04440.1 methylated-DNA--[protein]-cysteine S-methyltransferase [Victivallis vadensis]